MALNWRLLKTLWDLKGFVALVEIGVISTKTVVLNQEIAVVGVRHVTDTILRMFILGGYSHDSKVLFSG